MFDVARLLGDCLREVKTRDGPYLVQNNIDAHANFIVGGQVRGEPPRLFNVYGEGNFIEATPDTCYFQIGETKYGKPIIDRVMSRTTSLLDATKCTMVSFDSTMRSNISVGLPIDLLVYETDSLRIKLQRRIDEVDPYFQMVHTQWGEGLAARVRAASRSRLDLDGHPRRALASHHVQVRPSRQHRTARDPPAAGAALPHADPRLLAQRHA